MKQTTQQLEGGLGAGSGRGSGRGGKGIGKRSGKRRGDFDIQERTFRFAVRVVRLVERLPRDGAGLVVGRQVARSATSVGANVEEADGAESKRDFIHKMSIAHKEARETRYWLRIARILATG